ncbi:MAG: DUF3109 family protein [Gemmatimonadota bacterium]
MSRKRIDLPEEARHYEVDPDLLECFLADPGKVPATACDGYCCHSGVYLSLAQRDLILRHADAVRACMDPSQRQDPSRWFETEILKDRDFEGGECVGTEATDRGCVFLNGEGLCVLQIASTLNRELPQLKPFFCRLFPITVVDGELTVDDHCQGERPCCSVFPEGGIPVVEACEPELRVVLDGEEVTRLKERARKAAEPV